MNTWNGYVYVMDTWNELIEWIGGIKILNEHMECTHRTDTIHVPTIFLTYKRQIYMTRVFLAI
jgi:hypothetical protein